MLIKRLFDIVASLVGLIFLMPLLLIIALLVKIKMKGPVFFTQKRVGQYGRLFGLIKFRTMKVDHGGNSISVKGDNRITPLGRMLRNHKLDDLPQLWNVLKGDMSFVGPRPDVPGYADMLTGDDRRLLLLKPGITGPATLKYSREEELLAFQEDPQKFNDEVLWPDKVRINLEYMENRSFWGDIDIILKTIFGM
jgi:lipopolysaccharide/colanic/teichoic acid biosynthesis glycosyltransferase